MTITHRKQNIINSKIKQRITDEDQKYGIIMKITEYKIKNENNTQKIENNT